MVQELVVVLGSSLWMILLLLLLPHRLIAVHLPLTTIVAWAMQRPRPLCRPPRHWTRRLGRPRRPRVAAATCCRPIAHDVRID
jgi:hypothetical protein